MSQTIPEEPSFVDRDAAQLTADLVATFEAATGRTLQPAQPERLLLNVLAYAGNLFRINLQEAFKQSLVAYAVGPALEHLGLLVGVTRLGASGSLTTLRFSTVATLEADLVVPVGFRRGTKDGKFTFATTKTLVIPRGSSSGTVPAQCSTPGTAADGYQPGDVSREIDALAGLDSILNITETADGADPEDDDHLRARIMSAPEQFSVAGSVGAYRYHAMSASSDVVDVAVVTPAPGVVAVYPLMADGLPSDAMVATITGVLSADTIRPLCDQVQVMAPTRRAWSADARLTLFRDVDAVATLAAARTAAEAFRVDRRGGLGRDVVGSQLIRALQVDGVYRVDLPGWADQVLADNEWADGNVSVALAGVTNG
jgi:phage-related baseplate assembly protein